MHAADRIHLAILPTPLQRADRLIAAWHETTGSCPDIWVKRDDLTGFGLSGNKVRKLEYHLAAASAAQATTIITCGAIQSNHCRATALAAARLGLRTVLYLRTEEGRPPPTAEANHLLMRFAGAECRFITPSQYDERDELMARAAAEIGSAWVIPEGASDATGARGFVNAAHELAGQADGLRRPLTIWHPASSAGTTAGLVAGAAEAALEAQIVGCSVGDPAAAVTAHAEEILQGQGNGVSWNIIDDYVGGGYGIFTEAELALQVEATRLTGLLFDPTYTGKALYGLHREIQQGRFASDETVIFWHTGGGFALFAYDWASLLS